MSKKYSEMSAGNKQTHKAKIKKPGPTQIGVHSQTAPGTPGYPTPERSWGHTDFCTQMLTHMIMLRTFTNSLNDGMTQRLIFSKS